MSEQKTYEEIMIEIAQSGSNKKHCMEYAVDYAEKADNEIAALKAQRNELLAALKTYGAHLPNCAYAVNHPLIDKCTCGYEAAIASAEATP
jgi:hypothetical protein